MSSSIHRSLGIPRVKVAANANGRRFIPKTEDRAGSADHFVRDKIVIILDDAGRWPLGHHGGVPEASTAVSSGIRNATAARVADADT